MPEREEVAETSSGTSMDISTSPGDRAPNPAPQRQKRLTVSLKGERLARKVTLVFGFMSFIPLLVIFFFVFPHIRGSGAGDLLSWLLIGVIGSMFIGYFVLKHTVGSVMGVVRQARSIAQCYEGVGDELGSGDEIAELARKVIQELGVRGPGEKGKVMGRLMPQVKGRAQGAEVNQVVTEILEGMAGG